MFLIIARFSGPQRLRLLATAMLALLISVSSFDAFAQGLLPSLEHQPEQSEAPASNSSMTPVTELMGLPLTETAGQPMIPGPVAVTPHDKLKPFPGQTKNGDKNADTDLVPLIPQPQLITEPSADSAPQKELTPLVQTQPVVVQPVTKSPALSPATEPQLKGATTQPPAKLDQTGTSAGEPKSAGKAKSDRKKKLAVEQGTSNEAPVKPAHKLFKFNPDVGQAIQDAKNILTGTEKGIKPVSYSPLPGIAVFAVVKHGNERVFGDLPVLFAREYAQRLGAKLPQTKIYNPIYTVDELRMQGLGHIYDQIMKYYIKTGAPEPTATDYLLKQISTNRPTISRLVFVEADVDFTHPDASTNLLDRTKQLMTDDMPKQMKYFIVSHIQIFDAEKPDFPIVWSGNWQRSVKQDQFYNVTPSVYNDSDSQQAFARVSRMMSQEMIYVTPKAAYMAPNVDTDVEGQLVSGKQAAAPNLPDSQIVPKGLSHENKQAIERILQRQNDLGPK